MLGRPLARGRLKPLHVRRAYRGSGAQRVKNGPWRVQRRGLKLLEKAPNGFLLLWRQSFLVLRPLCCRHFRCHFLGDLDFDDISDQTPRALNESHLICQAGLQEHADGMVTGHVRGRDQSHVLSNAKVNEVVDLCQNEEVPSDWGLYFGKLLSEILNKYVVQSSRELHRLLADEFEALIKPAEDLV